MGGGHPAVLQLVRPAGPEGPQRLPDVRPPDGRTAPLRGGRMRLVRLAAPAILLALTVAACGGSQVTVEDVPGAPVELSVPGKADALAPTPTATASAPATATTTATSGTATTAQPQATATPAPATGGGGAAAPDDSANTDQPPPAGSDAQQFEEFCAQNPGAC